MPKSHVNRFTKGINLDQHPLDVGDGFYVEATNAVANSKVGDFYQLNNEKGTTFQTSVNSQVAPGNYLVIGKDVIENNIIYYSVSEDGVYSQIGIYDTDTDTYLTYVNSGGGSTVILTDKLGPVYDTYLDNTSLDFSVDHPIDSEARRLFDDNIIVYFSDNFNAPRVLNLDDLPDSDIGDNSELFPSQTVPVVDYVETIESGNIEVGTYQFVARFLNENLDPLYFGIVSQPVPVVDERRSEGRNKYDGNVPGKNAGKSIVVDVNNIDTDFQFVELIVISYSGPADTLRAVVYQRKSITTNTVRFTFSDKDTFLEEIELDELNLTQPNYATVKCVAQKDGRLVLSNLTSTPIGDLQSELANKLRLRYEIKDMEYVDVVEGLGVPPLNPNMLLVAVYRDIELDNNNNIIASNYIYFVFNKSVDPSSVLIQNFALVEHAYNQGAAQFEETISYPVSISAQDNVVRCDMGFDVTTINFSDFSDIQVGQAPVYTYAFGSLIGTAPYTWIGFGLAPANIAEFGNLPNNTTGLGSVITEARVAQITTGPLQATIPTVFTPDLNVNDQVGLYGTTYLGVWLITGGGGLVYNLGNPDLGINEANVGFQASLSSDIIDFEVNNLIPPKGELNNEEFFGDFIDEGNVFNEKTYMRDEVYSFAIQLIFRNGSRSPALHIPGNERVGLNNTQALVDDDGEAGYLGTYVSTAKYPLTGGYPSALGLDSDYSEDDRIRHHLMPDQSRQPIIDFDNNQYNIRLIQVCPLWGGDFENVVNGTILSFDSDTDIEIGTQVTVNGIHKATIINKVGAGPYTYTIDPPDINNIVSAKWEKTITELINTIPGLSASIQGYNILRQKRDVSQNRSVYAQGIAQRLMRFLGNGDNRAYMCNSYFFGKTLVVPGLRVQQRHHPSNSSIGYPNDLVDSLWAMYSPDFLLLNREVPESSNIKPVSLIEGAISLTAKQLPNPDNDVRKSGGLHLFANYNTYLPLDVNPVNVPIEDSKDTLPQPETLGNGGIELPDYPGFPKIVNYINEGYRLIDLGVGNTLQDTVPAGPEISYEISFSTEGSGLFDIDWTVYQNLSSSTSFVSSRYLYNIFTDNQEQYGTIDSSDYIVCHTVYDLENAGFIKVLNGDVFISKLSVKNSNNWRYVYQYKKNGGDTQTNRNARTGASSNEEGEELRGLMYFFIESEVNCNYRHRPIELDPITQEESNFGVPYYPNNPIITDVNSPPLNILNAANINTQLKVEGDGILDVTPLLRDSNGYNPAYSRESEVGEQSSVPFGFEEVSQYPNRSIYSELSLEGEQSDKYRFFPVNNVHDIPKHSGPIINTFVYNGRFWIHTRKSLWRTFVNELTVIPSSSGELITGDAGYFSRPSVEIFTVEGGYAGTRSQWGCVTTHMGHFFIDYDQDKIFMLQGEGLKEIGGGISRYLENNIAFISGFEDNPFNPDSSGYLMEFDYNNDRLLVTKRSNEDGWTLSYLPRINNYVSFHTYIPNVYTSVGGRLFSVNNNGNTGNYSLWEHNTGSFGVYYDQVPSVFDLTFSVNPDQYTDKVFDNFFLETSSFDNSLNIYVHRDTFDEIQVFNEVINSGVVQLTISDPQQPDDYIRLKNHQFQAPYPRDAVIDHNQDIFDPLNLDQASFFRPRAKGKYIKVKLVYNNQNNYRLSLNNILSLYREIRPRG